MRSMFLNFAAVAVVLACGLPAQASTILWYNGDVHIGPNGTGGGGTANEETSNRGSFNLYDDFKVTNPGGWLVNRVWSNNAMQVTGVTRASWSIRSGMSAGNGGTIIASGFGAATQTPTGRVNPLLGFTEYSIEVSGLNVSLASGTYWLSVSPFVGEDTGKVLASYNSTTSKSKAIGSPAALNANGFHDSAFFKRDFEPALLFDHSMGVAGVVAPEPSSFVLWGLGTLGLGLFVRRFRTTVGTQRSAV